jgi:hypothetical protein
MGVQDASVGAGCTQRFTVGFEIQSVSGNAPPVKGTEGPPVRSGISTRTACPKANVQNSAIEAKVRIAFFMGVSKMGTVMGDLVEIVALMILGALILRWAVASAVVAALHQYDLDKERDEEIEAEEMEAGYDR